jgi:hypothetical protein
VHYILLGLIILFFSWFGFQYQKKRRVWQWKKSLGLTQHTATFDYIYKQVNGFHLSREARNEKDDLDYIYGEIDFTSFIALLSLVSPNPNTVFYDLGSGIGKAVLACAMVYPVKKSVGVELLPQLHSCSCTQLNQLKIMADYQEKASTIHFILGDFLTINLEEATLIFINSTTLFGRTWERLCATLNKLPHVQTIITTSKPLISTEFLPQISTQMQMSWGVVPVYIHFRKQISTNQLENIE